MFITGETTLDTTYAPSDFADYDPAFFALKRARAVQFDFRDLNNNLVPTPKLHEVFRPGAFVWCMVGFSRWRYTLSDGSLSHVSFSFHFLFED